MVAHYSIEAGNIQLKAPSKQHKCKKEEKEQKEEKEPKQQQNREIIEKETDSEM